MRSSQTGALVGAMALTLGLVAGPVSAQSPSAGAPATPFDCGSGSGELKMVGFSAGNVEESILRGVLDQFQAACPAYTVSFEVIAGEYAIAVDKKCFEKLQFYRADADTAALAQ